MRRVIVLTIISLLTAGLTAPTEATGALDLPVLSVDEALDLAGVDLPGDGTSLILHADFPADDPFTTAAGKFTALTLDITPTGVKTLSAVPASAATADATQVEECTDPAFAAVGKRWNADDLPIEFAINHATVPEYMSPWMTTRSIREAHQAWGLTNSKCEGRDSIDFRFNYIGSVQKRVGYDGTSTTDFGRLDLPVALSYVWYTNTRIREVDLRFNSRYRWTNRAQVGDRYQVKNVAVHEIGHTLGLDDLSKPHGSLTMFGVIGKGELRKQTLGKGDVRGAELSEP